MDIYPSGIEKYDKKEKLGEGTYGIVYKAFDTVLKRTVALKKIRTDIDDEGMPSTSIREIAAVMELKHPNIVELYEVINNGTELYLVLEYMDQDLRRYIDHVDTPTLDPLLVKSYLFQLLQGLRYCHSHRILHRDLKPQNLLIDKAGHLKLTDFGLARAFCVPMRAYTHEVVTLWYRAPEILLNATQYSTGVDTWSVGTIFAEMLTKKPLFGGDCEIDEILRIFRVLGTPSNECSLTKLPLFKSEWPKWTPKSLATHFTESRTPIDDENALDLLAKFLRYEPSERISAKAALEHPYFNGLELN